MGYARAGFDVAGVDLTPQADYPFTFHEADALTFPLDGYDVIHASPPCQAFSRASHLRDAQGGTCSALDLLVPVRARLLEAGVPYVIENVPGAPLRSPVTLCGSSFGLDVRRHRLFESNVLLLVPECGHRAQGRPVGVYHVLDDDIPAGGRTARTLTEAQTAMGIDWLPWPALKAAIPPDYTELLGGQLLGALHHTTTVEL